jgi:hypothetical protein
MINGKEISIALTPCRKSECDEWRDGWCVPIRNVGKPHRPQVFWKGTW